MADGILAAVNENGNIDRFIDTKGGVHYIEPKRYEESVAKIDAAATKAKETVNSATEAVSECKAQTGACTQETARAKEIADTVESRITGIEGDIAALRDSVSRPVKLYDDGKGTCWYSRTGNIVTIVCQDVKVTEKKEVQLGVLPEELRPSVRFVGFGVIPGSSSTGQIAANVSGNVRIYSASGTGAFTASLTYPIV